MLNASSAEEIAEAIRHAYITHPAKRKLGEPSSSKPDSDQ
jgi:hypothetical protein